MKRPAAKRRTVTAEMRADEIEVDDEEAELWAAQAAPSLSTRRVAAFAQGCGGRVPAAGLQGQRPADGGSRSDRFLVAVSAAPLTREAGAGAQGAFAMKPKAPPGIGWEQAVPLSRAALLIG